MATGHITQGVKAYTDHKLLCRNSNTA